MSTYPERRRNASPCWYWLAIENYGGLVTVRLSSDVNVIHIWKFAQLPKTAPKACTVRIQSLVGPTFHLHVPGSAKELKHVFKVNVSKPKVDIYPQFREWWDTETFTYNYNGCMVTKINPTHFHLGTMADKVRPGKALLERLKWTKAVHNLEKDIFCLFAL